VRSKAGSSTSSVYRPTHKEKEREITKNEKPLSRKISCPVQSEKAVQQTMVEKICGKVEF